MYSFFFIYSQLNVKIFLFQTVQFSIRTLFCSIRFIDRTLSGAISSGQSGPWSNGHERVLSIPQNSSITEPSQSDSLVPYPVHLFLGERRVLPRSILLPQPTVSEILGSRLKICLDEYKLFKFNLLFEPVLLLVRL